MCSRKACICKVKRRETSFTGPSWAEEESVCLSLLLWSHPEDVCRAWLQGAAGDGQHGHFWSLSLQMGLEWHSLGTEVRAGTVRWQSQRHSEPVIYRAPSSQSSKESRRALGQSREIGSPSWEQQERLSRGGVLWAFSTHLVWPLSYLVRVNQGFVSSVQPRLSS